jgi:flagellar basal-body rod protein FlgB
MDLDKIQLMSMLATKMKYGSARQDAISQNIANVDTPGYKRQDIAKPDFKGMVQSSMLKLETTDPQHLSGNSSASTFKPYTTNDNVELDMEAIELMKNNSEFSKTTTTMKKFLALINEALGK